MTTWRQRLLSSKCLRDYGGMFLLAAAFFLFFYRAMVFSGFDLLPGDAGDARLNVIVADSWRDSLSGRLPLELIRAFYPFPDGRGFTDLSLSLYLLEIPFRALGADEIRAAQLVYILLFFIGVMTMFHLCRRRFRFSFPVAAFCALFAFLNHAFWLKQIHTQFYFLYLMPLLGLCIFRYLQLWGSGQWQKRWAYGAGACLVFAFISYANFYSAFFFALWFVLFAGVLLILLIRRGKPVLRPVAKRKYELAGLALLLLLLHLVFLRLYLPVMKAEYLRNWDSVSGLLPVATDILNIGGGNVLWGRYYEWFFPNIHKNWYELSYGIPPLTLTLTAFCSVIFLRRLKAGKKMSVWFAALFFSLALCYVLSLKVYACTSLWYVVWRWFPGGNGLRAPGRIYVFMMIPLTVFLGGMLERSRRLSGKRRRRFGQSGLLMLLFGVILLDNLNNSPACRWKYSETVAELQAVPPPPPDCRVFFLAPEKDVVNNFNRVCRNLEAWHIANRFHLFTINGYSGNFPSGWMDIFYLDRPEYMNAVAKWLSRYRLQDVSNMYNRKKRIWTKYAD